MNYHINADGFLKTHPTENVPHEKDNWESPIMDKFNKAHEYIQSINSNATFDCDFNSSKQRFTPNYERCKGMSKKEIDDLIKTINNF